MNNKVCVMCGKPVPEQNEVTCSRECLRKYQKIYNLIYGGLYRRFNGNNK